MCIRDRYVINYTIGGSRLEQNTNSLLPANAELEEIIFNNESLREAVILWLRDENTATNLYGHISRWNVSQVTDMSKLFVGVYNADLFNQPLNSWDVSSVIDMSNMFCLLYTSDAADE